MRHRRYKRHYVQYRKDRNPIATPPESNEAARNSIPFTEHIFSKRAWIKITIKAIVLSIIFAILTSTPLSFIKLPSLPGIYNFFTSTTFLFDFIAMGLVMIIFDGITSRKIWGIEDFFSLLFILLTFSVIQLNILTLIFLTFLSIVAGSFIGGIIRYYSIRMNIKKEVSGAVLFIVIVYLLFVFSLHSDIINPPSVPQHINLPYLTRTQLIEIFGNGHYYETPLSVSAEGIGGSLYVFSTPIKELLIYKVSLANVNANGGYLVLFYNYSFMNWSKVYYVNLTEEIWDTSQAGLLMQQYETSLNKTPNKDIKMGVLNELDYVIITSIDNCSIPNFLIIAQHNNYIAVVSCYGLLCRENAANKLVESISQDI